MKLGVHLGAKVGLIRPISRICPINGRMSLHFKNAFSASLSPIPLALFFCLANAFKPALIDDLAYLYAARQIVETPAHPFGPPPDGFHLIWYDRGQGAFTLLTPMVVPYWLAAGITLFGENLVLLKLWLFPICLLFTTSLYSLFKRYAPSYEKPLLAMTVFSPVFLPSLNLMVDVPAVALGVAAVAVFHRSLDSTQASIRLALLAGLLSGLAMQTKYIGVTSVAVIFLFAILRRQWRAGLLASAVALAVFVGWEAYLTREYGRSHFLLQYESRRSKPAFEDNQSSVDRAASELRRTLEKKSGLILPLLSILGAVGVALAALAMIGLRFRGKWILWVLTYLAAGYALMAIVPDRWATFHRNPRNWRDELSISTIFAGINAVLIAELLLAACLYLGFRGWSKRKVRRRRSTSSWFLLGWLAVELAGFFLLSPFAAVRRVMGITIAATLLVGRLVSLTATDETRRRLVNVTCLFGAGIGLFVAFTDYRDAIQERDAVTNCLTLIRQQPGGDRPIWFCGHWGFHYYAELEGLNAIYPNESQPAEGDWIIYPDTQLRPYGQLIILEQAWVDKNFVVEQHEAWPLRTIPEFYDGSPPIRHHHGPRLKVTIFRVKKKFLAQPT